MCTSCQELQLCQSLSVMMRNIKWSWPLVVQRTWQPSGRGGNSSTRPSSAPRLTRPAWRHSPPLRELRGARRLPQAAGLPPPPARHLVIWEVRQRQEEVSRERGAVPVVICLPWWHLLALCGTRRDHPSLFKSD